MVEMVAKYTTAFQLWKLTWEKIKLKLIYILNDFSLVLKHLHFQKHYFNYNGFFDYFQRERQRAQKTMSKFQHTFLK